MKDHTADCPECPVKLQPLDPHGKWVELAVAQAAGHLVELPGPLVVFPLGPLIVHHAIVHDELDLEDYITRYYNG